VRHLEGSVTQDQSEDRATGSAHYRSYLLRWWQEGADKEERVLLQDVLGGEPRCFSSLESLFAHLDATRGQLESEGGGGPVQAADRDDSQNGEEGRQHMNRRTGRAT
jgi:hypothetical protein